MENKVRQLGKRALEPSQPSPARISRYQSAVWGQTCHRRYLWLLMSWCHARSASVCVAAVCSKKIMWAHLGGFWPVWTLSMHCWHELYLGSACTSPLGRVASKHAMKIHFEGFVLSCLEPVCPYHVNKSGSNYNRTMFSTKPCCHDAEWSNWCAFTLCFSAWQTVEVRIQHCVSITHVFLKAHLWMQSALCPSQIWVQRGQCSRQTGGPHRLLHTERDEAGFCQQAGARRLHQRLQEGSQDTKMAAALMSKQANTQLGSITKREINLSHLSVILLGTFFILTFF